VEARDFRGQYSKFTALGAEVVGVSNDTASRHTAFAKTFDLPFPLVSDKGGEIAKAYGLTRAGGWLPSKRVTFVIDSEGTVRKVVSAELDVSAHAREALEAVQALD